MTKPLSSLCDIGSFPPANDDDDDDDDDDFHHGVVPALRIIPAVSTVLPISVLHPKIRYVGGRRLDCRDEDFGDDENDENDL